MFSDKIYVIPWFFFLWQYVLSILAKCFKYSLGEGGWDLLDQVKSFWKNPHLSPTDFGRFIRLFLAKTTCWNLLEAVLRDDLTLFCLGLDRVVPFWEGGKFYPLPPGKSYFRNDLRNIRSCTSKVLQMMSIRRKMKVASIITAAKIRSND